MEAALGEILRKGDKKMIEVRVRNADQADSVTLGFFTPREIPELPGLFQAFPTYDLEESGLHLETAQFVIDVDGTYFEIVVCST